MVIIKEPLIKFMPGHALDREETKKSKYVSFHVSPGYGCGFIFNVITVVVFVFKCVPSDLYQDHGSYPGQADLGQLDIRGHEHLRFYPSPFPFK